MNLSFSVLWKKSDNKLISLKKPKICEDEHFWYLPSDMYLNVSGRGCFAFLFVTSISAAPAEIIPNLKKNNSAFFIWMWKHHTLAENIDEEYKRLESSIDVCFYSFWFYCTSTFHSLSLSFIRDELLRNRYKVFFALFKNINNFTSDFLMTSGTFSLLRLDLHSFWI